MVFVVKKNAKMRILYLFHFSAFSGTLFALYTCTIVKARYNVTVVIK